MTDDTIFTHQLREPIKNIKGEEITEISFRKPRGGDIMRCGNPVKYQVFDEDPQVEFDEAKMAKMLSALSGIPLPMLERMDTNDMTECSWGVARFFLPFMRRASPA